MKRFFSSRVGVVLIIAVLLAAILAVVGSLTGFSLPDMVVKGILTPIRTGASKPSSCITICLNTNLWQRKMLR